MDTDAGVNLRQQNFDTPAFISESERLSLKFSISTRSLKGHFLFYNMTLFKGHNGILALDTALIMSLNSVDASHQKFRLKITDFLF